MMYKAALFDLDGTLADTLESIAHAANKALGLFGFPPMETEQYKYFAGDGADTLTRRILTAAKDMKHEYYEKVYEEYKRALNKDCTYHVTIFEGLKEALDKMKASGMKLAVVTNKPHDRAVTVMNYLYGAGYFDFILGADKGFPKKPDPTGALYVAGRLGANPDSCIYVGDTNVDMKTGKAAGMYTVGVLWGFRTKEELTENKADMIVSHPSMLASFVE